MTKTTVLEKINSFLLDELLLECEMKIVVNP